MPDLGPILLSDAAEGGIDKNIIAVRQLKVESFNFVLLFAMSLIVKFENVGPIEHSRCFFMYSLIGLQK